VRTAEVNRRHQIISVPQIDTKASCQCNTALTTNGQRYSRYSLHCTGSLVPPSTYLKPCVSFQVEIHPYHRNDPLIQYCSTEGIHVTAYSPLGSADSAAIMQRAADTPRLLDDPVVKDVAARVGKSPAQVCDGSSCHQDYGMCEQRPGSSLFVLS
jgi:hypothetical protein